MHPASAPDAPPSPGRFTLWSLLARTVRVWLRHLGVFTTVGLILDLPIAAVLLRGPFGEDDIGAAWLYVLLLWFVRMLATAALSLGVLQSLTGGRVAVLELLATPARQLWPIFAVAGAYSALVLLGLTVIAPGLFVLVAGYLSIPAVVAEPDMGTEAALRRSFVLTQGHRLQLLMAFAILFAIEVVGGIGTSWAMSGALAASRPAGVALKIVVDALLSGLTTCSFAVAYHDLRVLKGMAAPQVRASTSV